MFSYINNDLLKRYFTGYESPSHMYKKLTETKGVVNEVQVESIKKVLDKLQGIVDCLPKENAFKIEENEKVIDIVGKILEFNYKIRSG